MSEPGRPRPRAAVRAQRGGRGGAQQRPGPVDTDAEKAEERHRQALGAIGRCSRDHVCRLATGLAVHRRRAGLDTLGISAAGLEAMRTEEIAGMLAGLCRDRDVAAMLDIIMGTCC